MDKNNALLVECLQEKLKNNQGYTIFYSKECPYCKEALNILKNKTYKGYDFEKNNTSKDEILDALRNIELDENSKKRLMSHNTKPIIFYKQRFIGGLDNLVKELDN
mgnify:CR=1 FL=1